MHFTSAKNLYFWSLFHFAMAINDKILVIGADGQIGTELTLALREQMGEGNVFATDIKPVNDSLKGTGPYDFLDVTDKDAISTFVRSNKITQIYHMAAILSATGENHPRRAWNLNMSGLLHVLDIAIEYKLDKIFWPSSIATFGSMTPKENTPQFTIMNPGTVYGITKMAGEAWCDYCWQRFKLDVRSLRYPGIISYKTPPGGGTTDYAIEIFHEALRNKSYECFLAADTMLPMMYMPDAIRATLEIMDAPADQISVRSSYNVAGVSFTPSQIAEAISKEIPQFSIAYKPDFRQEVAKTWPQSIDDSMARNDWGWKHAFGLDELVKDMLANLRG